VYQTGMYEGMLAETVVVPGHNGDPITAYYARPLGPGPFPGVVLAHHFPGWDDWYKETTRKMACHGYLAISPNLYHRAGHGTPEDMAVKIRGLGGIPDDQAVGDLAGSRDFLRAQVNASGKVGVMGTCSGGRHAYLAACRAPGFDACVDLWGGGVVVAEKDLTPMRPVAPVDYTPDLPCPLLGLFGAEDRAPTVEQVEVHEAALKQHGRQYEFHTYQGAGHGFFYHHTQLYRQEAAVDGWSKVFDFLARHLGGPA
jgi:carboxymethylenebutenolidase